MCIWVLKYVGLVVGYWNFLFNYLFLKIKMINLKMSNFKIIFVYCIKENY